MRYLYLLSLALATRVAHGQMSTDTIQPATLLHVPEEVTRRIVAHTDSTGVCTETLSWGEAGGLVRTYYASGRLKEYVPYSELSTGCIHGLVTTWYESGQLESSQPFVQGKRDGTLVLYYENGQLKRQTNYQVGAELPGSCFDAAGVAVPYFAYEQLPLYPGGQLQLAKEINKAIRWPHDMPLILEQNYRTVWISFWVDKDGSIRYPQVAVSSQLPSLDRAVLNAIHRLARRFAPARRDGSIVQCKYLLPVRLNGVSYSSRPEKI